MRKIIVIIVLTLIADFSIGQTESKENQVVTEKFVENYNSGNYNSIFSMFADVMKDALPQDKTIEFLNGLKSQAGNISRREFVKYKNGTYASYKTTFENAVLDLNISINDNSKINGLLVAPFVEEKVPEQETVLNKLTLNNGVITKDQSELIFESVKEFPNNTQISFAIIKGGTAHYYGIKIKNDTILTVNNQNSVFEIGSITKIFTSTLLSNLVVEQKIDLNDNINKYIEIPLKNNIEISFIELANHTSGLPRLPSNLDLTKVNFENPYKEYTEKDINEYLSEHLELSNKGTVQYSNLGAGLLGYTLTEIENVAYENLLQTKIFSKYEMHNSTVDINKIKGNLVRGLNANGEEVSNWDFDILAGAGAILSTVEDLSLFAISQFDHSNKELNLTRKATFELNENVDIGLGWHILKSQSKNLRYWHNGGTGGYSTSMVIEEKSRTE